MSTQELTKRETLEYDKLYNQHPWMTGKASPIAVKRADGIYFWDYDGKRYTDMGSQLTNVNLGYGNQDITNAIKEQLDVLPYVAPKFASARGRSWLKCLLIWLRIICRRCFLHWAARIRMKLRSIWRVP